MATIKENYDAINEILRQNYDNVIKIERAIQEIEEMHRICIPILNAIKKPSLTSESVFEEGLKIHCTKYKVATRKCISIKDNIDKETLQVLLDKISPVKLIVEEIKDSYFGEKDVTISIE